MLQAHSHVQHTSTQRFIAVSENELEKGSSDGCQTCEMICKALEPFPCSTSGPHGKGRLVEIDITLPGTNLPPRVTITMADNLTRVLQCHSSFGMSDLLGV